MFGSAAPYIIYPDAQPFLRWARKQGIIVGVVSNAEYRYRDVILPCLGLNQVSAAGRSPPLTLIVVVYQNVHFILYFVVSFLFEEFPGKCGLPKCSSFVFD